MTRAEQVHIDEIFFNLYVDCGCSYPEASRQSGVSPATIRARVRRHSRRIPALSQDEINARRTGGA